MNRHLRTCVLFALISLLLLSGCSIRFKKPKHTANDFLPDTSPVDNQTFRTMTPQEIEEDFEALMDLIENNYPFLELNKRVNGIDFLANKSEYKERMKNVKTTEDLHIILNGIIDDLNNGHTHLLDHQNFGISPADLLETYSEIESYGYRAWVETLKSPATAEHYGNMKIKKSTLSLGNNKENTSSTAADNLKTEFLANGQVAYLKIKSFGQEHIKADQAPIEKFLSKAKESKTLIIDIRGNGGGATTYFENLLVKPLLSKPVTYTTYSLYKFGDNNKRLFNSLYPHNRTITLAGSECQFNVLPIESLKQLNLKNAKPEVFTDFDTCVECKTIVNPSKTGGFNGKIYLLIDADVYSSSEALANFSKATGFATLVGSKTGGDGIGRDPGLFALPNSGLVLRYACDYGIYPSGEANEEYQTEPDFFVKDAYVNDNIALDSCVLEVLNLEGIKL